MDQNKGHPTTLNVIYGKYARVVQEIKYASEQIDITSSLFMNASVQTMHKNTFISW
jgi:hypothetical protein